MFKFGDGWWLNLIWVAFGALVFGWLAENLSFHRLQKAFGKKTKEALASSVSLGKRRLHLILQSLAIGFFGLALARPLMGMRQQEVKQTGIEMIVAIDVSNSMLAEDDKPSRLEHAKHEIYHLLDLTSGNRVGLMAFAGSAILVSPMTTDHGAIKIYLSSLSTNSVSTQGTDFKDVIREAIRAFERGGVEGLNGTKPTRALIIASDGEDNEHGATGELIKAKDQGIRVFALGFGSARGSPIPLRDDRGNLRGYKKDRSGQVILSVPSDEMLTKLSRAGGGSYYHSTFDESEIRSLAADLDKLEKADFKSRISTDYDEKFQIPLLMAIFFGLLDLIFGTRKNGKAVWRGRFGLSVFLAALFIFSTGLPRAWALGPPSVQSNNDGIRHYNSEEYPQAFSNFADALARDSMNPQFHLNLGDTFYKGGEPDKALAEYGSVEQNPHSTPNQKFQAMFNAGNVAIEMKDIPKALQYYQKALDYNPDSIETKTNIELALNDQQKQGGSGDQENKEKKGGENNKDQQNKNQQPQQPQNKQEQNKNNAQQPTPKPTPRPFKSEELSENDVRRILEELKRQEEEIRARQYKENRNPAPERPVEKDW